jgi:hypothetical protein
MSDNITPAPTPTPTDNSADAGNIQPNTGEWFLADGVQGTGEKPDYYLDKYSSLAEQAKAYPELQQKFGAFKGSPDEYTMADGTEYNSEHPLFAEIQAYGKENNLSQEGYQGLVNVLLDNEKANIAEQEEMTKQVMKDLGPNANERVQNIDDFLNANMEASDDMKGLVDLAKGQPGGVELLEAFIGMTKKTAPASEQVVAPIKTFNKEELHSMQFAKDEYGNRKMNDPSYRKMVEEYSGKLLAQG